MELLSKMVAIMIMKRPYLKKLKQLLTPGKAVFVVGPRRAGKTTLVKQLLQNYTHPEKTKFVLGDNLRTQQILSSQDKTLLSEFVENIQLLVIDEIQFIPNIGMSIKLILDTHPYLQIVATGSASLEIVNKVGEPLVGRKFTLHLYPFSIYELHRNFYHSSLDLKEDLNKILMFGLYPEVFLSRSKNKKILMLNELVESYLLKDILTLKELRHPFLLHKLLQLLAYQIGNLVSFTELSRELGVDVKTVEKYIWLLEKSFIIKRVSSFSRNLRNELKKSKKYYFLDLGIRNALIQNFNRFDERADKGQLWENFLFIERLKKTFLTEKLSNHFFWRTKYGQEIDLIEEREGKFFPYEFKLNKKSVKTTRFEKLYSTAQKIKVINRNNFLQFIT